VVLSLALVIASGVWWAIRSARRNWARTVALPEIARLIADGQNIPAFRLAQEAERYLPGDAEPRRLIDACSVPLDIGTNPAGAEVRVKDYTNLKEEWLFLGVTPLEDVRVPGGYLRWEVKKEGFEAVEGAFHPWAKDSVDFTLVRIDEAIPGMVRVPAADYQLPGGERVDVASFWLDRYEVTNADFKAFVDTGGYRKSELWKEPFVSDRKSLAFEEAMERFRDTTGRPGPSTWELGSFPEGERDFPVRGVSWYEAAAYCEFAGKTLPTVHHWTHAGGRDIYSDILVLSKFGGEARPRWEVIKASAPTEATTWRETSPSGA
jgi:hypothetical protein